MSPSEAVLGIPLSAVVISGFALYIVCILFTRLFFHPLRRIPGPAVYSLSSWRLAYDDWGGNSTRKIHELHLQYGPVVRIGLDHVSFNSLSALRTIYGAGSRSQRTSFYKLFEPYGVPTMFTMPSSTDHSERKKMLARVYTKSGTLTGGVAHMIEERVCWFLQGIEGKATCSDPAVQIGEPLHWFTLDVSSAFIYGPELGTQSLREVTDRRLFADFEHPLRRKFSWAAIHQVPIFASSMASNMWGRVTGVVPDQPAPFTLLRAYGRETFTKYQDQNDSSDARSRKGYDSLIAQLWKYRGKLEDIDIASECVDHLLAGVETTRNTLVFLIWALSLPEYATVQQKLRAELQTLPLKTPTTNLSMVPSTEQCDTLPYLGAVVKEALRLYAPLPALQPRAFQEDTIVDNCTIPARTTVSVAPYTIHRNDEIFPSPKEFRPERWLEGDAELTRWWWPFSSGGRMCTGSHLALAEITTLVAALYVNYTTSSPQDFAGISPAITSRFEIFWDERFDRYVENQCPIEFHRVNTRKAAGLQ